jgi:hypothetical protein
MTATVSPTLSVSPSPSELVAALDEQALVLAEMIDAKILELLRAGAEGWHGDVAAFDGFLAGWRSFVDEEVAVRLAATFDLGAVVVDSGQLSAAAPSPPPGAHEATIEWAGRAAGRFHSIGGEIQRTLRTMLPIAIQEGWTADTLAERLYTQLGLSQATAMTMARTEMFSAYVNGARSAAERLPNQPVEHVWWAVMDNATRPAHAAAHEQTVPFNSAFTVGNDQMSYPHDRFAPAAQTINCRCIELFLHPGDHRPNGSIVPGDPNPVKVPKPGEMSEFHVGYIDDWAAMDPHAVEAQMRGVTNDLNIIYNRALEGTGYNVKGSVAGANWASNGFSWSSQILDADGNYVGEFQRQVFQTAEGVYNVEHSVFLLNKSVQGQGIAARLNGAAFDYYRSIGIENVTVHADIDVGGYAWARQGFDWDPGWLTEQQVERKVFDFLRNADDLVNAWERRTTLTANEATIIRQQIQDLRHASLTVGEMPTPFEISRIGEGLGKFADREHVGKSIMLHSDWMGIFHL